MAQSPKQDAQAAWDRIEGLGGHGVWEPDMVVVSLAATGISDDDLKLFSGFPHVQILDLSDTAVSDDGLFHIAQIPALVELIVVNTRISDRAIDRFRKSHPAVKVTTQREPKDAVNPFTGKPF